MTNLGSIVCTDLRQGGDNSRLIYSYEGLSQDIKLLPRDDSISTGSSFYAIDTGDYYKYEMTTKKWYKQ